MIIAAGGTGGHMFPALSTFVELERRGWRVEILTDPRGADYLRGRTESGMVAAYRLDSPWRGTPVQRMVAPLPLLWVALRLAARFLRARPACVLAFGGYATAPALAAATLLGVPRIVHEQNAVLGRVNGFFLRFRARLAYGVARPQGAPAESLHVGIPVRPEVVALAGRDYRPPKDAEPVRILVIGGSQGSRAVARLAAAAVALFPRPLLRQLVVDCQVRTEDAESIESVFRSAGVRANTAPFFPDLPDRIAASHLVLARAGASTLAELSRIGRPAILIPLPTAAGDHQAWNARAYASAGAARVFEERGGSPQALAEQVIAMLGDSTGLQDMARAARRALPPGAASELASLTEREVSVRSGGRG